MCGISGFFDASADFTAKRHLYEQILQDMKQALTPRGPHQIINHRSGGRASAHDADNKGRVLSHRIQRGDLQHRCIKAQASLTRLRPENHVRY